MTMENKYYQPSIDEFRVGFEYEFRHSDYEDDGWIRYTTPEFNPEREDSHIGKSDLSEYRVKFLDREDIESCGWVCTGNNSDGFEFQKIIDEYSFYDISFDPEDMSIVIEYFYQSQMVAAVTGVMNSYGVFKGKIKNLSEFKQVIKMLGIE